ncbi:MAG: hypothetical protein PHR37_07200 [Eubacteriales bacterium]|nr:hypothetical protein [Eubacteriales bacterium]
MEGDNWMEIRNDRLKGLNYTELGKKYHIDHERLSVMQIHHIGRNIP